jgi:DNA-binding NarL/FixJ family response regulator
MRVLVVDDVSAVRSRLVALLGEVVGADRVAEAGDFDEALIVARCTLPQVIVLDLHLRGASGIALLPRLKAEHTQALVIVLTNDPSDLHRRQCVAVGADFFFDKSRDFDRVAAVLSELSVAGRFRS